jgi:hypothetical protein
VELDLVH